MINIDELQYNLMKATMVEFTMFTILKVHTSGWGADMNTLRMMAAQVEKQDSRSLCKLEVEELKLNSLLFFSEQRKSLLELIKVSEECMCVVMLKWTTRVSQILQSVQPEGTWAHWRCPAAFLEGRAL